MKLRAVWLRIEVRGLCHTHSSSFLSEGEVRRGVKYSSPSPLEGEGWGEGWDFLFNVNSLSSPYVVGGPKSLISRRGSYFRITFLFEILRSARYDKYNREFGGKAPDDSSHLIIRVFLFRFCFFFFHRNKKEKVNINPSP